MLNIFQIMTFENKDINWTS